MIVMLKTRNCLLSEMAANDSFASIRAPEESTLLACQEVSKHVSRRKILCRMDSMVMRSTGVDPLWWITIDGDKTCLAMYERHYSAYKYRDGRSRKLFCGPGEKLVLRTAAGNALFVWRKFIDRSGQQGINCAVFRNESSHKSSELIRQADEIADCVWPGERHYTFVNSEKVRSSNPGFCFLSAGWRKCGFTKGGLLILERK